jgi:mono/diheme cytochrome c family protein
MKHKSNLFLLSSFLAIFLSGAVFAQSGEATYKQVCMSCHGAGVLNAPKLGDKANWAPLIAEGQVTLTAHGYVGVRAMPAKGGNPNLSIEGFADALVYIVNNSGGKWKSPNPQTIAAINKEVEARKAGLNKNK